MVWLAPGEEKRIKDSLGGNRSRRENNLIRRDEFFKVVVQLNKTRT
jgi:hypothetical protein